MSKNLYEEYLQNKKSETEKEENLEINNELKEEIIEGKEIAKETVNDLNFLNETSKKDNENYEEILEDDIQNIQEEIESALETQNKEIADLEDKVIYIETDKLLPDENQAEVGFGLYSEQEKERMKESIKTNGIIHPILVRTTNDGFYKIIDGRNRFNCAVELDIDKVPCIARNVDDDTAKLIIIETTINRREKLDVMSQARAYKMQADIYKRKNIETKKIGEEIKDEDKVTNKMGKEGLSYRQKTKLIKLTKLIEEYQELVNRGKININLGSAIASLSKNIQKRLFNLMNEKKIKLNEKQITKIKEQEYCKGVNSVDTEFLLSIIEDKKEKRSISITFTLEEIEKYFEGQSDAKELKEYILSNFEESTTAEDNDQTGDDETWQN